MIFSIVVHLQKVKLFSSSPPPRYRSTNDITEVDTELKDFKSKSDSDSPEK